MAKSQIQIFMEVLREEYQSFLEGKDILVDKYDVDHSLNDYYTKRERPVKNDFDAVWEGAA